jgi:hypothetical protein
MTKSISDLLDLPIISLIEGIYSNISDVDVYWSLHPYEFISLLEESKGYGDFNYFYEVGTGIGFNVMIAGHMGFSSSGIEIDERLFNFSKKNLGLMNVVNDDIFNINYIQKSIVFCNRISTDEKLSSKAENHIIDITEVDSIIIFPNPTSDLRYSGNSKLVKLQDKIYKKLS